MILTSGTTGTPKGAQRSSPDGLLAMAALIDKIPYRGRETMMIAAPLFHSWGFFHFVMSLPTASTMVLRRRFDPEETLRAVQEHRAEVLAVVPVMLQRILRLPEETLASYDLSSLRITSVSGSALPGELAIEWMDRFGDNVYNLYGSTEVAYATVATPEDLRAAPGNGRPAAAGHGRAPLRRGRAARCRAARWGGSSSATRCPSRATPAAAARRRSTACSAAATSAISTPTAASSSTGATTR